MVYASSTRALAALECIVHVDLAIAPADLRTVTLDVPDALSSEEIGAADLPPGWERFPAPTALAEIGSAWIAELRSAVLFVPSAVVAEERNILLNPLHPEFTQVRVLEIRALKLDPRILD